MNNLSLKTTPISHNENIVAGDKYRITVLTPALVRLEYNESGKFLDMPTQTVLNRDFPKVDFRLDDKVGSLEIVTDNIRLYYDKKCFSANGLKIKIYGTNMNYNSDWFYGKPAEDLGGTARTLDNVNGATSMESGVLGRNGFAVLDDSSSLVITEKYVAPREDKGIDIYVFCYGHEYRRALKDFYYLCGNTPMLPRFALGNWWSRYYRYSEESYMELMDNFAKENIPFSVAVVDMDWHLVNVDRKYGSGWTGYTWNKELFPDHVRFLDNLKKRGMKVTLNVHPAEGVRAYEECYPVIAKHMGVNTSIEEPVEFDCTNESFMEAYFNDVHHPMEDEGVDFWWIDWQQGNSSKLAGLDPLWILNHYHFLDNGREGKRPMTFSRYAGPGSHRYPVGFSGDTHITWESLDFQPYFTANASNIGYGWWSHDIGGHMLGKKDNELELRWYQFGVFSPIMRLHSSCNEFSGKEPWNFPLEIHVIMNDFLRLRHRMVPYLYSMNYLSYKGSPLISPMYYDYPEEWDAYVVKNQYYFGTELIVAPITTPSIKGINRSKVKVWLPEGLYFDIFTDTVYTGGRFINMYRDYESIPVLAKAGAIIPLTEEITGEAFLHNPKEMEIKVYPGADNTFMLYEDDGETSQYEKGDYVITSLLYRDEEGAFIIKKPEGNVKHLPERRSFKICFSAVDKTDVNVIVNGEPVNVKYGYDKDLRTLLVCIDDWDYEGDICIMFNERLKPLNVDVKKAVRDILNAAEISYIMKDDVYRPFEAGRSKEYIISEFSGRDIDEDVRDAVLEQVLAVI